MTATPPADVPQEVSDDPSGRGVTRVSPHVVERIAAYACNRASNVVTPRTDHDAPRSSAPRAHAEINGRHARLSLAVGTTYPSSLVAVATSVRAVVIEDVQRLCGLQVIAVDVDAQPVNLHRRSRVR